MPKAYPWLSLSPGISTPKRVALLWWYRFPRVPHSGLPAVNFILPIPGKILKLVPPCGHLMGSTVILSVTNVRFPAVRSMYHTLRVISKGSMAFPSML